MRSILIGLGALLAGIVASASAVALEKQNALDGSGYTVIAPVYDGSSGSLSYIRLFNGGTSPSTFNVTVVNAANGFTLGTASIQVPAHASPQYPLTSAGGPNSIFTQAGVGSSGGSYAIYIQNSDALAGYEHVTFNGSSLLFENNDVCATPIDQQFASSNQRVVTNVHTTALGGGAYPSTIAMHNHSTAAVTVTITAYDATSGAYIDQINQAVAANATVSLSESQIQAGMNFAPTSTQYHINLMFTNAGGGALPVEITQTIHAASYGGDINMGEACAMNAVAPRVVTTAPTVPVAYCGSFRPTSAPYPYSIMTYTFTVSTAPNGRLRATSVAISGSIVDGGTASGTLTGSSFSATDQSGLTISGTIQNGQLSGTYFTPYGNIPVSASTSACSS